MAMLPEQFYKERILTCSSRRVIELPWPREYDAIHIEKDLFEWRLYYKKNKYLSCSSEWEARYLKIWLEVGLLKIEIPNNNEILQQVTVELEVLAKKILKVAEDKLIGYRLPIKREVLQGIWQISESESI